MVERASWERSRSPLLVGGIAVLTVGGLVGLAFLVSSLVASNRDDLELAYLPPDAEMIIRVRVADVWQAPLLEPVTRQLGFFVGMASAEYGLSVEDVDSITIAVAGLSEAAAEGAGDGNSIDFSQLASGHALAVIRTTRAIPIDKVTADGTKLQHAGTAWYRFDDAGPDGPLAAFFPAVRTAVIGSEASVKAAIDRGPTAPDRPDLAFADFDQQILVVIAPKDPAVLARAAEQQAAGMANGDPLPPDLAGKVRAISLGLTVTEGVDFQMRANCADAQSAERVQAEIEQGLDQVRGAFGLVRTGPEERHQPALELVERMLTEASVTRSETIVELAAALPRETKDAIARLANEGALNPFAMAGGSAGPAALDFGVRGEVPIPPEAISVADFNRSWQVGLDVQDQPAGEVLTSLAEPLRLELTSGPGVAAALNQRVSIALDGVSRFAAIEAVCGAIGVHPRYSAETGIELRLGPRGTPVAFAGPFLIDVEEFEIFPQYATGHLKLRLLTAGLPPSLRHALENNDRDIFSVEGATSASGEDLTNRGESIGTFFAHHDNKAVFARAESVHLKSLLRHVDTIAVRGRIQLALPTQTERIRLEQLTKGASGRSGGIEITIQNASLGGESSLELRYKGAGYSDVVAVPYDANSEPLPVTGSFGGGSDSEGQLTITIGGRPASLVATVVTRREDVSYNFELKDLLIPDATERPERLPSLEFAGHAAPVSVESLSLSRSENPAKARLRAVNHSNKDVRRLALRLDYIGADGKKIDDWPAEYSGAMSSDDGPPLALAKSARADFEVTAFFLPAEARQVQARLLRVGFADGTVWEASHEQ